MRTSSVMVLQLMLMQLLVVTTKKTFAAQHKTRPSTTHLGTYEEFRGQIRDTKEPIASQSSTSYAQLMADGGNPNTAEENPNNQLASQFTARTPILLRTLFRTVDNSIVVRKTPTETFSRFFPKPSQTFRATKTSPETVVENKVKLNQEGYSSEQYSVQDGAKRLNNANTQLTFQSEPEKGYNQALSPPAPAPPPPPIILRETQQLPPIQRVIEQVLVPMEIYHTIERQVPVPVPVIQQVPFPQPVPLTFERPIIVERRIPEPIVKTFYSPPLLPPVRTTFQVQSSSFPMTMWNKFSKFLRNLTTCCQLNNQ